MVVVMAMVVAMVVVVAGVAAVVVMIVVVVVAPTMIDRHIISVTAMQLGLQLSHAFALNGAAKQFCLNTLH